MIVSAGKHEGLLTANGVGAFGRLEFVGDLLSLRVFDIKQLDGHPKMYFDGKRVQVLTGIRYAPVGRRPFRVASGYSYKIVTNVEFVKPIPKGLYAFVVPTQDFADSGGLIVSAPFLEGYKGVVSFATNAMRGVEIDEMAVVAHLVFVSSVEEKKPSSKKPAAKKTGGKDAGSSSGKSKDAKKTDS